MLTKRQKLSIEHLNFHAKKEHSPKEIILWAQNNMLRPKERKTHRGRSHSKLYYQQIIAEYIQRIK